MKLNIYFLGSPKIKEIVNTFNSSATKRKGENGVVTNGTPVSKKAKKDSSSEDSSSDEDEAPAKKVRHYLPVAKLLCNYIRLYVLRGCYSDN